MTNYKYHRNCGLSKEEWELEKIVDQIKAEPSTLLCIGILARAFNPEPDPDFYDEWIALWPTAKELSKKGVERIYDNNKFRTKLKNFTIDFFKHTGIKGCKDKNDFILRATKAYLAKLKSGKIEWEYIMTPGNFISHQYKGSSLAMYIKALETTQEEEAKVDYRNMLG